MSGLLSSGLFCLAAFAALCLAQERHHEEACGRPLGVARQRGLWALAVLAGIASLPAVLARPDSGIAWTAWVAQLTLAALAVAGLATWRPRALPALLGGAAVLALLGSWPPS